MASLPMLVLLPPDTRPAFHRPLQPSPGEQAADNPWPLLCGLLDPGASPLFLSWFLPGKGLLSLLPLTGLLVPSAVDFQLRSLSSSQCFKAAYIAFQMNVAGPFLTSFPFIRQ